MELVIGTAIAPVVGSRSFDTAFANTNVGSRHGPTYREQNGSSGDTAESSGGVGFMSHGVVR